MCDTCTFATQIHGQADSEEHNFCSYIGKPVNFKVVKCSVYEDKRLPSLNQMSKIAWTVATNKSGKSMGFVSPQQLKELREKGEVEKPGYYQPEEY